MTIDPARFGQMERNLQYLMDRQAILDVVSRHARGHDRFDVEIMTACYHPDGIDEHGAAVNVGPEFGAWANENHAAGALINLHNITTHTCEIDWVRPMPKATSWSAC